MAEYRLYSLDGVGRIDLSEVIQASTDGEAVAKACELKPGTLKCEVWEGSRLVATLDAQDLSARQ